MPRVLPAVLVLAACGSHGDAAPDAVTGDAFTNPFVDEYDDPADFPRDGCLPGTLAGWNETGVWLEAGLRTALEAGELVTYATYFVEEVRAEYTRTDDDLLVRYLESYPGGALLHAIDVCGVDAEGRLVGHQVVLATNLGFGPDPRPFLSARHRRIDGEAEGLGLSLRGELALPAPLNVRVDGDIAYLPTQRSGLRIVSIADPTAPVEVGSYPEAPAFYNDVKLIERGGRRYAVLAAFPVVIVDVTTPTAPTLAATLPEGAHTLFIEDTRLYLADGGGGPVPIYDLTEPRAPARLGAFELLAPEFGTIHDLYVEDSIAYLSDQEHGLRVVDFTDPAAPVQLGAELATDGRIWHSPWRTVVDTQPLLVHGDEGTDGLVRLLDLRPGETFLDTVGEWTLRPETSVHNVMARGARAYVAHYHDGLRVLDLSDPTTPALIAHFNTWQEDTGPATAFAGAFGLDLDPARGRIYVADSIRGLVILDADATVFP